MKKFSCLLMVIILALSSIASMAEEEFTIHSGVTFGLTVDEVISKEKEAGFSDVQEESLADHASFNCETVHQSNCVVVNGQIAGVKGANITYHFDTQGKLDSAVYILGITKGSYAPIRTSLIDKYGEPIPDMGDVLYANLGHMDIYSMSDFWNTTFGGLGTLERSYNDAWLIPQDDNTYVVIVGHEWTFASSKVNTVSFAQVGYQRFGKEEVDEAIARAQENEDMIRDQLKDDL